MTTLHDGEFTHTEVHATIAEFEQERARYRALISRLEAETLEYKDKLVNFEIALQTSRRIGAAVGILMSRHYLNNDEAFQMLRTASQARHCKIRDLAEEVIYTGALTMTPDGSEPAKPAAENGVTP